MESLKKSETYYDISFEWITLVGLVRTDHRGQGKKEGDELGDDRRNPGEM